MASVSPPCWSLTCKLCATPLAAWELPFDLCQALEALLNKLRCDCGGRLEIRLLSSHPPHIPTTRQDWLWISNPTILPSSGDLLKALG